jgi:formylglycine-generating enzyme required for sulfatase activity
MMLPKRPMLFFVTLALVACSQSQTGPAASPIVPALPVPTRTEFLAPPSATPLPTDTFVPSPTSVPTPGIGSTEKSPVDSMVMDYIPAGSFLMGSADSDGEAYADEKPQHPVSLNAFWIDQTEVTNGQYGLCMAAGACKEPARVSSNLHDQYYGNPVFADYPVIWVSWNDAQTYCKWAGRRLPTEAEWEKAARGADGRIYPWGNTPPDKTLADFGNQIKDVTKTASYPAGASPYGALDMAGNVWNWWPTGMGGIITPIARTPTRPDQTAAPSARCAAAPTPTPRPASAPPTASRRNQHSLAPKSVSAAPVMARHNRPTGFARRTSCPTI